MKRKVAVVWGRFGKHTDFVLEPVCKSCEIDGKECEVCKDYIYIEKVTSGKESYKEAKDALNRLRSRN